MNKNWVLSARRMMVWVLVIFGVLWVEVTGAVAEDPLSGDALYADVVRYAELGQTKRSGTRADFRVSAWLSNKLTQAGLEARFQPWLFDRFQYYRCRLIVDGTSRDCFSLWYPNNTRILSETASVVGVRGYSYDRIIGRDRIEDAITAGAPVVIAVNHVSPLVAAINASADMAENPWPVPVILVGGNDSDLLDGQLESSRDVGVMHVMGQERPESFSRNVLGLVRQGAAKTVVISTPITAWFTAAGERGPGIALWLGMARWAMGRDLPVNLIFLASSGHELGYMGTRRFLDRYLVPDQVLFWVHLGASIVTVSTSEVKFAALDFNDDLLADALNTHLRPVGFDPRPDGPQTSGELAYIMEQGYRAFGFYGAFDEFHTRQDFEDNTAPEPLEAVARSLVTAISELIDELLPR